VYSALIIATLLPQHSIAELRNLKQQHVSPALFFSRGSVLFSCDDGVRAVCPAEFALIKSKSRTIKNCVEEQNLAPTSNQPLSLPGVSVKWFDLLFRTPSKEGLSQKQWVSLITAAEYFEAPLSGNDIRFFRGASNGALAECSTTEQMAYQQCMERIKNKHYFEAEEKALGRPGKRVYKSECAECHFLDDRKVIVIGRSGEGIVFFSSSSYSIDDYYGCIKGVHGKCCFSLIRDTSRDRFFKTVESGYASVHDFPELFLQSDFNMPTYRFTVGKKIYCILRDEKDPSALQQWFSMQCPWATKEPCVLMPCDGVVLKESGLFVPKELAGDLECADSMPTGDVKKKLPYNILPINNTICFLDDSRGISGENFRLFFNKRSEKVIKLAYPCIAYSHDFSELAYVACGTPGCITIRGKDFTQSLYREALVDDPYHPNYNRGFLGGFSPDSFFTYEDDSGSVSIFKKIAHCDPTTAQKMWSERFPHDEQVFNLKIAPRAPLFYRGIKTLWKPVHYVMAFLRGIGPGKALQRIFSFSDHN
jgi:hypothetical protein